MELFCHFTHFSDFLFNLILVADLNGAVNIRKKTCLFIELISTDFCLQKWSLKRDHNRVVGVFQSNSPQLLRSIHRVAINRRLHRPHHRFIHHRWKCRIRQEEDLDIANLWTISDAFRFPDVPIEANRHHHQCEWHRHQHLQHRHKSHRFLRHRCHQHHHR